MKIYKILLSVLISAIFSLEVLGCAYMSSPFDVSNDEFNFLDKRLVEGFDDESFLTISNSKHGKYWDREYKDSKELREENIDEWYNFLEQKFTKKDVEEWIYRKKNLDIGKKEAVKYMAMAKKYQKYVRSWGKKPKKAEVKKAIEILDSEYKKSNSKFIKLRYSFLILRLKHYYGFYKEVTTQTYTKDLNIKSVVSEWIDSLVAGAEKKLKNRVKASYLFAKIFQNSKTKTHIGFYDFSIKNDMEWNELMDMCQNSDEKTLMYAIRGLQGGANGIEELENIYKIDPDSKWFNVILFREIKKLQYQYFAFKNELTKFNLEYNVKYENKKLQTTLKANSLKIANLKKILEIVIKDDKKKNLFLTKLASNYLNIFQNNDTTKIQDFTSLKSNNEIEKNQIKLLLAMLDLLNLKTVDENIEIKIGDNYNSFLKNGFGSKNYLELVRGLLPKMYDKDNSAKSHLLQNNFELSLPTLKKDEYLKIKKLESKQNKNSFEKLIISKYQELGGLKKDKKLYIEGILNLKDENFKQAKELFTKIDDKKMLILQYNPFNATKSGTNRKNAKRKTNLIKFIDTFTTVKGIATKDPSAVMDNYLLANAYYNLSSFGNSPMITRFYRATSGNSYDEFDEELIQKAIKYYKNALENTKKSEFKAKITYMLAKCEYKNLIIKEKIELDYSNPDDMKEMSEFNKYVKTYGYGKYFDKIKKDYKDTKYYKEVIKECGTYNYYQKIK